MVFIAYDRDKRPMMKTKYFEALPDSKTIDSMQSVGYTFKIDGKRVDKNQILKLRICDDDLTDAIVIEKKKDSVVDIPDFPITSRTIVCIETGEYFRTQKEASEQLNLNLNELNIAVNTGKSIEGYTFKKAK